MTVMAGVGGCKVGYSTPLISPAQLLGPCHVVSFSSGPSLPASLSSPQPQTHISTYIY